MPSFKNNSLCNNRKHTYSCYKLGIILTVIVYLNLSIIFSILSCISECISGIIFFLSEVFLRKFHCWEFFLVANSRFCLSKKVFNSLLFLSGSQLYIKFEVDHYFIWVCSCCYLKKSMWFLLLLMPVTFFLVNLWFYADESSCGILFMNPTWELLCLLNLKIHIFH